MAAQGWTLIFGLIAMRLLAGTAQVPAVVTNAAAPQELNVTTPTQDYVIQNQRQYESNTDTYEREVAEFRKAYLKEVDVIEYSLPLIAGKYREVDERLTPLLLLDGLNKYCVQKYQPQIDPFGKVRSALSNCANTARNNLNGIITYAESTMRSLINYYANNLKTLLTNCEKPHNQSSWNYTICVTKAIATADAYTLSNRKTFEVQMETAKCSADSRIRSTVDCSFNVLYNAISKISVMTTNIENCAAGQEFCPPCVNSGNSTGAHGCDSSMAVSWTSSMFQNATIQNPFFGLSANHKCMQVNFIQ